MESRCLAIVGQSRANLVQIRTYLEDVQKQSVNFVAGSGNRKAVKLRVENALYVISKSLGGIHPWTGRYLVYNLVPSDAPLHRTLDMALIAAMIKDSPNHLYCGEVDVNGEFLALPYPLEVGRLALDLEKPVVVPACSAAIVALSGAGVYSVANVEELLAVVSGKVEVAAVPDWWTHSADIDDLDDLRYIKGQQQPKWALEVAIAGGHNLILVGPPGEAKSEIAKRAYTIAPPLSQREAVELTTIWHAGGRLPLTKMLTRRPCVEASQQSTPTALLGGGNAEDGPIPGLVSLAHKGVLLSDELPEWSRAKVDSLRIPMQDKQVTISRRDWQVTFPADFQLIATANPCPCGYYGHPTHACVCTEAQRRRYSNKISGPVADRLDIKVRVEPVGEAIFEPTGGETSASIAARVEEAVSRQHERYSDTDITRNGELRPGMFELLCKEQPGAIEAAKQVQQKLGLSSRAIHKLRGLARTIADLRDIEEVTEAAIWEASKLVVM